ncbi:MAG: hypothetical protein ISS15_20140 [Alphaproteobacteria bacterium]|nr:hypothetical protein [Alphaproteobacteria bacterium]
MTTAFKLLGQGFDTIQLSFQTRIPDTLAAAVKEAQALAKRNRRPEPVELGPRCVKGEVLSHGGGGGDAMFSTGEFGELYFIKTDQKGDEWGVTVKLRALTLLCLGLPEALDTMFQRVSGLGLSVRGYSLGRIDYRLDVLCPGDFKLEGERLVRPNRSRCVPYISVPFGRDHPLFHWNDDPDDRVILRGAEIATFMVGKIGTSVQSIIYDKLAECRARRNLVLLEAYGLMEASDTGLFRVEFRWAGDTLKRHKKVRDFRTLGERLQPLLVDATRKVRYVQDLPCRTNSLAHERLHPLWEAVAGGIQDATIAQPSQFAPERAGHILLEERKRSLTANITGCSLGLAAMSEVDPQKVIALAPEIARKIVENALVKDPSQATQAVRRANL